MSSKKLNAWSKKERVFIIACVAIFKMDRLRKNRYNLRVWLGRESNL
jgi:hypothetical protein